jgi:hypothetical protein
MTNLTDACKEHLLAALHENSTEEKDFHIRQALQACGVDDIPEDHPGLFRFEE